MVLFERLFGAILLSILTLNSSALPSKEYLFTLERIEGIPGTKTTEMDFKGFRVIREGDKTFMKGKLVVKNDIDNTYFAETTAAYSKVGNQYSNHGFNVPKAPFCKFLMNTYKNYFEQSFADEKEFVLVPAGGLCPLTAGTYTIKKSSVNTEPFPMNIPLGFWKIEELISHNGEIVGGLRIFGKLEKL